MRRLRSIGSSGLCRNPAAFAEAQPFRQFLVLLRPTGIAQARYDAFDRSSGAKARAARWTFRGFVGFQDACARSRGGAIELWRERHSLLRTNRRAQTALDTSFLLKEQSRRRSQSLQRACGTPSCAGEADSTAIIDIDSSEWRALRELHVSIGFQAGEGRSHQGIRPGAHIEARFAQCLRLAEILRHCVEQCIGVRTVEQAHALAGRGAFIEKRIRQFDLRSQSSAFAPILGIELNDAGDSPERPRDCKFAGAELGRMREVERENVGGKAGAEAGERGDHIRPTALRMEQDHGVDAARGDVGADERPELAPGDGLVGRCVANGAGRAHARTGAASRADILVDLDDRPCR